MRNSDLRYYTIVNFIFNINALNNDPAALLTTDDYLLHVDISLTHFEIIDKSSARNGLHQCHRMKAPIFYPISGKISALRRLTGH